MTRLQQSVRIAKANLRHNLAPHLLLGALTVGLTPVLFGIGNLDAAAAWTPLELFACLCGVVLLTPCCAPELRDEIAQTVDSKLFPCAAVLALRILCGLAAAGVLCGFLVAVMRAMGTAAGLAHWAGCFANAVFLGGAGALTLAAGGNLPAGYMVPLILYAANYSGGRMFGVFYLFSGSQGRLENKYFLFAAGAILLALVPPARELRRRLRG